MKSHYFETKQMRGKFVVILAALSFVAIALGVRAAEKKFELPAETAKLKPGPGVELTSQCLMCHSADYISTQPRLTRTVWTAEVNKMIQKYGAPMPTNMVDQVVQYLTVNYGQENQATNAAAGK